MLETESNKFFTYFLTVDMSRVVSVRITDVFSENFYKYLQ